MLTIKLKKIRNEELQDIKSNILDTLPVLNKRQIRRHRLKYCEALILELLEDQFEESAHFIEGLLNYQDEIYRLAGDEALAWTTPVLKEDKAKLDVLYEGLKAAETGIKNNQKGVEVDKLVALAIYFSNQTDAWWWIAEQLFMQAVHSVKQYYDDGNKKHAIVCYIFGKFLLKQLKDIERAKEYLKKCQDLSHGQNWTATEVLKVHQDNLFKECCFLLHEIYLILAQKKLKTDPAIALKLSIIAFKRALNAETLEGQANCLYHQGSCELALDNACNAVSKLSKALLLYFSINYKTGVCETRILLALAHNRMNQFSESKYHLHQMNDYTEKHNLLHYLAQCHRYLGELHLIRDMGEVASTYLLKALEIFHELGDVENREKAKNLAAIATGKHLSKSFMMLINSCDKKKPHYLQNLMKLLHWKDSRLEFWDNSTNELNYLNKYLEMCGEYQKTESTKDSQTEDRSLSTSSNSERIVSNLHATAMSRTKIF